MGAFDTGFNQGRQIYNSGVEQRRQQVLDERATRDDEQKQVQYKRTLGMQVKEDAAVGGVETLERGIVPGGNWSTPEGYGADGPVPENQQYDPGAGLKTRPASDKEYNQAYQRVALAKRDMAGLSTLRTEGKNIDYNASILKSNATWDKKTPEEKAALIKQHSYDQNIPGFGNWVAGKGKTEGYANYLPNNGDPLQLSNKETRDFFSLVDAMEIDPVRARKEMDGVSDKVRTMAKEVFDSGTKAAKETNDTRGEQGKLAVAQQVADQTGEYQRGMLARAGQGGAKAPREADPALVKRSNDLYDTYINEADPAKRKGLERQWQMTQTQIATSLGKTQMLPNSRDGQGGLLKQSVEQKKNDDGSYTAFDKSTGEALYNTHNGDPMPLGMTLDRKTKLQKEAADSGVQMQVGENNGRLEYRYIGADGNPYVDVASAGKAKAPKAKTETAGTGNKTPGIDTSRYSREQVRGGSSYTYNPRGKTKAEWAAQDQNPQ